MAGVNNWHGIGNLTRDPEVRTSNGGLPVCNFTIACTTGYGDKKRTLFMRCVCFGKTADAVGKYLVKGAPAYVCGEIQTRSYEKNGQTVQVTEAICNTVMFLGSRGQQPDGSQKQQQQQPAEEDDIPF